MGSGVARDGGVSERCDDFIEKFACGAANFPSLPLSQLRELSVHQPKVMKRQGAAADPRHGQQLRWQDWAIAQQPNGVLLSSINCFGVRLFLGGERSLLLLVPFDEVLRC